MRPTIGDAELLAIVCAVLTIGLLAFTFAHAAARVISHRRRRPRLDAASHAVAAAIAAPSAVDDAATALRRLPWRAQVEVLTPFTGRVTGAGRDIVAALAEAAGLEQRARRWRHSRRSWRRLQGTQLGLGLAAPTDDQARLLADPDPYVSAAAADWAGEVGGATNIETLLDLISDPSPLRSFAAMNAVVHLGHRAVAPLEARLHLRRTRVVDRYLDVAAIIGDAAFAAPAQKLVTHPTAVVRARAASLLGSVGDATVIDPLHRLTMDSEPEVRAAAAFALGRLRSWESSAALGLMLRDKAWIVRRAAMLALVEIGNPGRLVLRGALNDDDPFVRDIAGLALGLESRPAAVQ